ncbi:transcriptional regulator [Campylobacter cuniculorum]|uniref:Uncharacterized protein n=1 Tax=Campylobacter cuniculorum DSM 23162 = LMG 24588 TaxID=1121267 RepID=A0A1W6BXM2_9BACT|nr:transcriptional regulator [Campylobacter cuniculorum]ARJ56831.1 hypothetical protein CCUN_1238 [Campylobacter cuniculorum DSM 23162 = LMG 24588]
MSKYLLKNKDKIILEFEVKNLEIQSLVSKTKELTQKIKNIHIINSHLLPKNLKIDGLEKHLELWIKDRKIPKNRQFVENIVATYSINQQELLMDYIDISFGLSLNDSFWIVPNDKNYQWKDYNLYENEFSEALQRASFGEELLKIKGFTSSPEYTTNGMLKKCWHRENNIIYLYKGQTKEYANGGKEAYSEYYMAQIAQIMEFECVFYDLKLFHNELVSVCPIFTNENEGFMPVYQVFRDEKWKGLQRIELIDYIAKYYSVEKLQDLLLFDALICNKDRHLGNFGMMIDNNTNEILRPAPIFDNGFSMINILIEKELKDINAVLSNKRTYFDFTFDEQLKLFVQERHKENLEKLTNFSFKRHSQFNLSEEWLIPIENCIRTRAKRALEFLKEKNNQTTQETQNLVELNKKLDSSLQRQKARTTQQDKNVSSLQENKTQTLSEKHKKRHR